MQVVFTDLDGCLLDQDTYSFDAARPALEWLTRCGIPLVFVSSKTRSELAFWRRVTGNVHPFVMENGGAIVIPKGYFERAFPGQRPSRAADVIELGMRYAGLVSELRRASRVSRCRTLGFNDMTPEHIASKFSLSLTQAKMARKREFDEPFLILDGARKEALLQEIEGAGLTCSSGARLLHLSGHSDKGIAVRELIRRYRLAWGPVRTLGLGDGMNDLPMLESVSVPVILRSPAARRLSRLLPSAIVTEEPGPEGWNQAVLSLIAHERAASRQAPQLQMRPQ
jgi:mannosyl-3-phosphoglycerate phosphatase